MKPQIYTTLIALMALTMTTAMHISTGWSKGVKLYTCTQSSSLLLVELDTDALSRRFLPSNNAEEDPDGIRYKQD